MTPPKLDLATVPVARTDAAVREVQDRLRSTQRHLISHRIGTMLCWIIVLALAGIAMSATADWFLELAATLRAAWLIGIASMISAGIIVGWRQGILTYTLSDVAVEAENRLVQFGQRLRTTLDYEQGAPRPTVASESLLSSLRIETFRIAEQTEWGAAIDPRPLLKGLLLAGAVALAWSASLILMPEFRIAAARAILLPFEYTTVSYSPQISTIKPGESVTVTVVVSGRSIPSAQLRYRPSSSLTDWVTIELKPSEIPDSHHISETLPERLHGELTFLLSDICEDTQFEVLAGPRPLPAGLIHVLQPLTLEKLEAHIVPPSYTGRPNETAATPDFKVLEGSSVNLKLEFNRPAAEVRLTRLDRLTGPKIAGENAVSSDGYASTEIPLLLQDKLVLGTLSDLRTNVSYALSAHTADGMSLDSTQINIRVQPDLKPQVQFLEPPEELVVTATTEVPMVVEAGDDLGLHKVGVLFQIGSGPMQTLLEQSADGSAEPVRLSTTMMLEEHRLTIQDAVTYYAFAEDNYFDQPRRTTTPLRFIDIRPYKMEFQIIESESRASDGSSMTLEELITRQRQSLSKAFHFSQESGSAELLQRLVEDQEALLDATVEFSTGMAERGADVPSLKDAITSMNTAIDALKSPDLTKAVAAEQTALASLIRARENLRKLLNQSNSQTASAQRQFDRQQRQKLRMPKKKPSDQQEQLAQARQKLEDLAKREREWSKQAKQCSGSASSSSGKQSETASSHASPSESSEPDSASESSANPEEPSETRTPAEVAAAQEKLQAELAEIQQQLKKLNAAGQAAHEQANQAAESMAQGLDELKESDGDSAAKEGERAAEQLEELSAHLAAMNARDFGQRLDQAQKAAQQLASRQQAIEQQLHDQMESRTGSTAGTTGSESEQESGERTGDRDGDPDSSDGNKSGDGKRSQELNRKGTEGLARDQQGLASQTEMLAELLDGLERDAAGEAGGVRKKLQQIQAENPPREIADGMKQTADQLLEQRTEAAAQGSAKLLRRLRELSQSLGAARGEFVQPQLKDLMALEEQLAQLQQQMKRADGKGDESAAAAGRKWQQLESRLNDLAAGDRRLEEAMRQFQEGPQGKKADSQLKPVPFANSDGQQMPEGFYSWLELGDFSGLREVSKALQSKIQEAILAGALMDADQPVPPDYRELVEKYYRTLSDDLR
jgi:hypothetical protein